MTNKWKKVSSRIIFEHPRLTLIEDIVELPGGHQTDYLRHGQHADYPTIVAIDKSGRFLLIREHAYPINEKLLQFPEGDAHKGESVLEAAARELHEEASLKAEKFTVIGHSLREHRRSTTKNFTVVAEGLSQLEAIEGDPEEIDIELVWLTEDEVWQAIANGEIMQKNTLTSWSFYQAYKRKFKI